LERDEILALLRERILRFAASRLTREGAEDVTQETLLLIHEKYPHVAEPGELLPLAFQIVRFKMAAAVRKSVRHGEAHTLPIDDVPLQSRGDNPERAAANSEMRARLRGAISTLGERCREIFRMKLEGASFDDIRLHFGVESINTIYTWDARCRRALLDRVGGQWESRP
jgi:RNA polymerase sigma-70 factor, ECF subfamily